MNYQSYLQSDRWLDLKDIALAAADYRCQLCNWGELEDLQVHHRTYENLDTDEELLDLIVLCKKCHLRFHDAEDEYKRTKKSDWKAIREMVEEIHTYLLEEE